MQVVELLAIQLRTTGHRGLSNLFVGVKGMELVSLANPFRRKSGLELGFEVAVFIFKSTNQGTGESMK